MNSVQFARADKGFARAKGFLEGFTRADTGSLERTNPSQEGSSGPGFMRGSLERTGSSELLQKSCPRIIPGLIFFSLLIPLKLPI